METIATVSRTQRWGGVEIGIVTSDGSGVYHARRDTYYPKADRTNTGTTHTFTMTNGVPHWTSNGHVPPADSIVELAIDQVPGFDAAATIAEREAADAKFIAEYRAARAKHGYSSEERAEMRAAFGDDATIVDVLTGKRVTL